MFDIGTNDRTNIMISEINEIIKKSGLEFSDIDIHDLENLSEKLQVRKSDSLIPKNLPNLVKLCKVLESFGEHSEIIHYPAGLVKLIKIATTYPEIIKQHSSSRNPSIKNNPSFNLIIETSKDSLLFHQFLSRLFVWDWCLDLNFQPSSKAKLVEALVVEHSISNLSLEISKFINELNLDAIQLHGNETPEFCNNFKVPVIKALSVSKKSDLNVINNYDVHAILLDNRTRNQFGGTGKIFNWKIIENVKFNLPIILSGGLNENNILDGINQINPHAVDINSGVEKSPGLKSKSKIFRIVKILKQTKKKEFSFG
jgi:phosphoribosylanthranilate isomerase